MLLFVDKLTNSDFSYLHPERGLVGETWLSHIELEGQLDEQGMVCDFGIVKLTVRRLLDDLIDHRLLVPAQAPQVLVTESEDYTDIVWQLPNNLRIEHRSPNQCITLLDTDVITPESVARWCEQLLSLELPQLIENVRVSFSVENIDGPYYHYSHGLKKHEGKCQRIAHGHRSRIQIESDGARDTELEWQWAQRFADIYIGTEEDLCAQEPMPNHRRFRYQAPEGDFMLLLPETASYLIASDSTVECIAQHIADCLKSESPQHTFRVKAFEGLDKGAVVVR
jgi:6-pyruvoyl-tetrahydropterin synthase